MDPDNFIDRQWRKFEQEARRTKMAKWKREKVANIVKGKIIEITDDGKEIREPDYIKIERDVSLKKGEYLNLESQKDQIKSLNKNRDKMSDEVFAKALERIEAIPDFVRFEIIKLTKD